MIMTMIAYDYHEMNDEFVKTARLETLDDGFQRSGNRDLRDWIANERRDSVRYGNFWKHVLL